MILPISQKKFAFFKLKYAKHKNEIFFKKRVDKSEREEYNSIVNSKGAAE